MAPILERYEPPPLNPSPNTLISWDTVTVSQTAGTACSFRPFITSMLAAGRDGELEIQRAQERSKSQTKTSTST